MYKCIENSGKTRLHAQSRYRIKKNTAIYKYMVNYIHAHVGQGDSRKPYLEFGTNVGGFRG